jgi:hypothetical protein
MDRAEVEANVDPPRARGLASEAAELAQPMGMAGVVRRAAAFEVD